jgi:hypothetical protein
MSNNIKSKLEDLKKILDEPIIDNIQKINIDEQDNINLSNRQKQFCIEYLKCGNGSKSAIAAGYSSNGAKETASRLLTYNNIQLELKRLQELSIRSSNITKEYIQEQILELIEDSYNDEKADRQTITKCLDMLNKMNSFYTQTNVNVNIEMPPLFPDIN